MEVKDLMHLNEILEKKDSDIYDLKEKIKGLETQIERGLQYWRLDRAIPIDDFRRDLPVPRLEMIYESIEGHGSRWIYGTVRKAHKGMRESWDSNKLVFTPHSMTTSTGPLRQLEADKLDTPFRDCSHFEYDAVSMNLPAYVTCPEMNLINHIEPSESIRERFLTD